MKRKIAFLFFLLIIASFQKAVFAEGHSKNISQKTEYAGFYQIGPNSITGVLQLIISGEEVYVQIRFFDRVKNRFVYVNLSNPRISGDYLEATDFIARIKDKGLLVKKSNIEGLEFSNIFGDKYELSNSFFVKGNYPQASLRILDESELKSFSKEELKIMRNQIFARYGYSFKTGGEMDKHFRKEEWYSPVNDLDINKALTGLETSNINKIRKSERQTTVIRKEDAENSDHSELRQKYIEELSSFKKALQQNDMNTIAKICGIGSRKVNIFRAEYNNIEEFFKDYQNNFSELRLLFGRLDLSELKDKNWIKIYSKRETINYIRLKILEAENKVTISYNIVSSVGSENSFESSYIWVFTLNKKHQLQLLKTDVAG